MAFYSYLYFYPLGQSKDVPFLLTQSIKRAAACTDKVIVAGPIEYKETLQKLCNNLLFFEVNPDFSDSVSISTYTQLVSQGVIKSNHPPTEIHCINRWLFLDKLFRTNSLPLDVNIVSVDWDCLLFSPFREVLSRIDIFFSRLQNTHGHHLPLLVSHVQDAIHNQVDDLPIFNICPSVLIANSHTINLYQYYLSIFFSAFLHGSNVRLNRLFSRKFFSDMFPGLQFPTFAKC